MNNSEIENPGRLWVEEWHDLTYLQRSTQSAMWEIGEVKAGSKNRDEITVIIQVRHDGGWTTVVMVEVVGSDWIWIRCEGSSDKFSKRLNMSYEKEELKMSPMSLA